MKSIHLTVVIYPLMLPFSILIYVSTRCIR